MSETVIFEVLEGVISVIVNGHKHEAPEGFSAAIHKDLLSQIKLVREKSERIRSLENTVRQLKNDAAGRHYQKLQIKAIHAILKPDDEGF